MKSGFIVHKAWFPVYLHVPTYEINLFSRIFLHRGWLELHGPCYNTNTRPFKHSVFVWYSCENKCNLIGGNASSNLKKTKKKQTYNFTAWKVSLFGVILVLIIQRTDQNNSKLRTHFTQCFLWDYSFILIRIISKCFDIIIAIFS